MAKQTGLGDRFYINGYDLSGDVGALGNISTPRASLSVTGINKSAHERILGLADVDIQFTAFYNDAAGRAHPALKAPGTTNRLVLYSRGSTKGQAALMSNVKQLNYDPTRGADGSLSISIQVRQADGGPPEWGELLTNGLITQTGSGNTASRDDAAATSKGLAAQLHVTAKGGTSGSCTIRIQDSTDNALWTLLKAFTAFTAQGTTIPGKAERVTVGGTVNRYMRINSTLNSTGLSFVVATRRGAAGSTY